MSRPSRSATQAQTRERLLDAAVALSRTRDPSG